LEPNKQWIAVKVIFEAGNPIQMQDWIADIFYSMGLAGLEIEGLDFEATDGWVDEGISMPNHHAVIGYFENDENFESRRLELTSRLSQIENDRNVITHILYEKITETDWLEAWKTFFAPQKISHRIVVTPSWQSYPARQNDIVITIDPGQAFGTGTHPTTMLCVRLLETYLKPGHAVADIGTGSGILLIAAAKLGAGVLTGVDADTTAIAVAQKNLLLNDISPNQFTLQTGHLLEQINGRFDLVVANIFLNPILTLLDTLLPVMSSKAVFICSGFIRKQQGVIADKLERMGLNILATRFIDDWAAMAARRQILDSQ
jgi:ribosomal protein L11 methyltransferase